MRYEPFSVNGPDTAYDIDDRCNWERYVQDLIASCLLLNKSDERLRSIDTWQRFENRKIGMFTNKFRKAC